MHQHQHRHETNGRNGHLHVVDNKLLYGSATRPPLPLVPSDMHQQHIYNQSTTSNQYARLSPLLHTSSSSSGVAQQLGFAAANSPAPLYAYGGAAVNYYATTSQSRSNQDSASSKPKLKQMLAKLVNKSLEFSSSLTSKPSHSANNYAASASTAAAMLATNNNTSNFSQESAHLRAADSYLQNELTTSDKIYDAFVSYDKRDEAQVARLLSVELEFGAPQYR